METYLTQLFISPIYSLDPYFFIVYENIIYSKINDLFYFKLVKHKQNQKTINEIEKEPPTKMGQKQYGLLQIQKILRKKMWSFQRGPIHPFSGFLHMHLSNPWHPDNSVIACKKKTVGLENYFISWLKDICCNCPWNTERWVSCQSSPEQERKICQLCRRCEYIFFNLNVSLSILSG